MRTPNCKCLVCDKPMYRRPHELLKVRHVACVDHRALAQKISGITEKQRAGLSLGSTKGTNHRTGYVHRSESKIKASMSHKAWCAANPDKVRARGEKNRGNKHYNWKGGVSRINMAIRRMTENRKWMDAVKLRDRACLVCGSSDHLESHHITPLSALIERHGITNISQARECESLWDLDNGTTLCVIHHYKEHRRRYAN